jgi:hypothetical protein
MRGELETYCPRPVAPAPRKCRVVRRRTFWKKAIVPRLGVFPQEPAIAEVIVSLDKLDAVPAPQTKLVRTPGQELVCSGMSVKKKCLNCHMRVLRTTTRVSPGLHCSVWVCDRCIFAATAEASWAGAVDGRGGRAAVVGAVGGQIGVGDPSRRQRWFISSCRQVLGIVGMRAVVVAGASRHQPDSDQTSSKGDSRGRRCVRNNVDGGRGRLALALGQRGKG